MIRAREVLAAGSWDQAKEADMIALPHDGRHIRKVAMRGSGDTVFLLDLAVTGRLRDGDGLRLGDGRIVRVIAASEPVAEITAADSLVLARIAWHLGSRHIPVQVLQDSLRIPRNPAMEESLQSLGAKIAQVDVPFEPEEGTTLAGHAHRQGHHHQDHEHGADSGCGHDHSHHHHDRGPGKT